MAGTAKGDVRLDRGESAGCPFGAKPVSRDFRTLQRVEARWAVTVPLMEAGAPCGFPSPADDYLDKPLDFNELLIANPSATFCVRVTGDSMIPVLFPEDIGVVDRSLSPVDKSIVLACLDGDFTIKRYRKRAGRIWLQPENPRYQPIYPGENSQFEVWGVIWRAVRLF